MNIDKIKIALSDANAPWYGSDLVEWVGDLIEDYERLLAANHGDSAIAMIEGLEARVEKFQAENKKLKEINLELTEELVSKVAALLRFHNKN